MPIETIIAPVGKSDPSFDLQADIIFGGNGGAKINKFLDRVIVSYHLDVVITLLKTKNTFDLRQQPLVYNIENNLGRTATHLKS